MKSPPLIQAAPALMVAAAAIRLRGRVFTGTRHLAIARDIVATGVIDRVGLSAEYGFTLVDGTFVDRLQAAQIALGARQVAALKHHDFELSSEDLWPEQQPLTRDEGSFAQCLAEPSAPASRLPAKAAARYATPDA